MLPFRGLALVAVLATAGAVTTTALIANPGTGPGPRADLDDHGRRPGDGIGVLVPIGVRTPRPSSVSVTAIIPGELPTAP